jgi:CRP-like cAMP-binding protein
VGPVEVLRVPATHLRAVLLDCPLLAVFFLDLLSREIDRLTADMNDLLQKDAEARLASWLLRRIRAAPAADPSTGEIQLTERKRQIATQLGVKPETLSRLLRALNRKGLVEVLGYRVRVLDPEGLKALAAG